MKGETSGNTLQFIEAKIDCDQDALLIKARPTGSTCHEGTMSCFNEQEKKELFSELFCVIEDRKKKMPVESYTTSLFREGVMKICAKVEEESDEVIKAATKETKRRLIEESVDLMYHLFVLLVEKGIPLSEVLREVEKRRRR